MTKEKPRLRIGRFVAVTAGALLVLLAAAYWGVVGLLPSEESLLAQIVEPLSLDPFPAVRESDSPAEVGPAEDVGQKPTSGSVAVAVAPVIADAEPIRRPDVDAWAADLRVGMRRIFARWGVEYPVDSAQSPCDFAGSVGLRCRESRGTWNNLRLYDRPAVLRLQSGDYAAVIGVGDSQVLLALDDGAVEVPLSLVDRQWLGDFLLLWKPPGGVVLIGPSSSPESLLWLRRTLAEARGEVESDLPLGGFDMDLRRQVEEFQNDQGIAADGLAGPETLIRLNTATAVGIPRLREITE